MARTWRKGPNSGWQGGSSRRWRKARQFVLEDDPLCADCRSNGVVRKAEHVHHIHELSKGGSRFDPDNMVGLCREHHQLRHGGKVKGHGIDGAPLDPEHHWNKE
jgi:5-methylcytosine-specific restriction enzyme A